MRIAHVIAGKDLRSGQDFACLQIPVITCVAVGLQSLVAINLVYLVELGGCVVGDQIKLIFQTEQKVVLSGVSVMGKQTYHVFFSKQLLGEDIRF